MTTKILFPLLLLTATNVFAFQDPLTSAIWKFKETNNGVTKEVELLINQEANVAFQHVASSNAKLEPIVGIRRSGNMIRLLENSDKEGKAFVTRYFSVISEDGRAMHLGATIIDPKTKNAVAAPSQQEIATLTLDR